MTLKTKILLIALALTGAVGLTLLGSALPAKADPALSLCQNAGTPTGAITAVMVVMLENESYSGVIGNTKSPSQTALATQCGVAQQMYGATHTSAANYLAIAAGQYPAASPPGCGNVKACGTNVPNLFAQMDAAGLGWKSYVEDMGASCIGTQTALYKIGHNPAMFYGLPDCKANDVSVDDLNAQSGPLWDDLSNQALPGFSFVIPNLANDGSGGLAADDVWLAGFLAMVGNSPAYQSGHTLIVITYDEGIGKDAAVGEDCTNQARDVAGLQPSCHIPSFVIYPWSSGQDTTFFTHYSITRTVDELFGLPPIAGAAGATSLRGHFGIQ